MIGVLAHAAERRIVQEFFELFKVPWEFCRTGATYDVVLCSQSDLAVKNAGLVLVYGADRGAFDEERGIEISGVGQGPVISRYRDRFPVYRKCLTFVGPGDPVLWSEDGKRLAIEFSVDGCSFVRLGFDLFAEVEQLLKVGQPLSCASIPTLDLQISLLRDLIISHRIQLTEIPPIPAGHNFTVCLTHDLDHVGIRRHGCDHTTFGFLKRAILGSLIGLFTSRKSFKQLIANWRAAFSLPFVHLGLLPDFWKTFQGYREIEQSSPSTFFVVPRSDDPGTIANGPAPSRRAVRYELAEIKADLQSLTASGCEVGVHGIDAWHDVSKGRWERETVQAVTGQPEMGVRMHWLYFGDHSPALLEKGGFFYDSSVGYNEVVGYRAGTSQAFRPLDADRLLELPLHAMDTALFFPSHMNLKPSQAKVILDGMIANFVSLGGVFTVNWHDRSIAPERQWDQTYRELLDALREKGAWFATGAQAVAWFRKRRAARFETTAEGLTSVALDKSHDTLPALEVRRHNFGLRSPEAEPDSCAPSNPASSTERPPRASRPTPAAIVS